MKTLVVYESQYGNTRQVAEAIAQALGTKAVPAGEVSVKDLPRLEFLVVGSPTQGGRPMPGVQKLLAEIKPGQLKGVRVAAFDTRFELVKQGFFLKALMKTIGYAAGKMAKTMREKGGKLMAEPEGFIVTGKEGPLKEGEQERAERWAGSLAKTE